MQSYSSHPRETVFYYHLVIFCHYLALLICYEKYQKLYDINIFFNFFFTKNMIFPSVAENQENMIFTLSVFTF